MSNKAEKKPQKYILVTACKNEASYLPYTIKSVVEQTIKPMVWVIVDDGSTDNTPEIIKEAKEKHEWIKSIRLKESSRDLGFHLSSVVKTGFDFATEYCKKYGINYQYLCNLDGDQIIERTFFEELIAEFEKDPRLGIASGSFQYINGNRIIEIKYGADEPAGSAMLIRRECFEDCGGIQITQGWDSTLKAKARIRGWKTRWFGHVRVTETKDFGEVEGYWKRYMHKGTAAYYFNLNPIHVTFKSIKLLRKKPHYIGIAYLAGYFGSLMRREEKIEDEEIRKYFWNKWKKYFKKG